MRKYLLLLSMVITGLLHAQEPPGNVFWVQFNTKVNTPYTIDKPELYLSERALNRRSLQGIAIDSTDLPVNPAFIDSIKNLGFNVKHISRWMNGVIAYYDASISPDSIFKPGFVSHYELRKTVSLKSQQLEQAEPDSVLQAYYGQAFHQLSMLGGEKLHQDSKGDGVHVAVIDAGFLNTDQLSAFEPLYARGGVLGTFDFVQPGNNIYTEHYHGNAVLSIMAGQLPGSIVGSAPDAMYWLLRSEDVETEFPVEEDYWIVAAEFADFMGCDVINTSLGYTTFDHPDFNHTYEEFDGKTVRISLAANLAVDKGIIVVCSAGNSGNDSWGHIAAPAEAEKVLAVGAVDAEGIIAKFSSRGLSHEFAPPKPDVSAMGVNVAFVSTAGYQVSGNGTSFSSPIVAGLAACLRTQYPEKKAGELIEMIRNAGDRFPAFDTVYGYGIPDFSKLLKTETVDTTQVSVNKPTITNIHLYPNPFDNYIFIDGAQDFHRFELQTMAGTTVFSVVLHENQTEILSPLLSTLTKGVYFAVLKGEQMVQTFKLIKN
ncbi:MAG: S8 family serine peptidase [Prolixibacteraceae bacterium]|nr:S8 family serine peptidase [Prolixibacteraceae bacterium]